VPESSYSCRYLSLSQPQLAVESTKLASQVKQVVWIKLATSPEFHSTHVCGLLVPVKIFSLGQYHESASEYTE